MLTPEEVDSIAIGPFNGTMDMLRISDIVRYTEDFVPSRKALPVDDHTRVLFHFDSNLKGASAFSRRTAEAR